MLLHGIFAEIQARHVERLGILWKRLESATTSLTHHVERSAPKGSPLSFGDERINSSEDSIENVFHSAVNCCAYSTVKCFYNHVPFYFCVNIVVAYLN